MKRIFAIVVSLLAVTALSAQEKERSYDECDSVVGPGEREKL